MVKRKDFLYDEERGRLKQIQKAFGMSIDSYLDAFDEGKFENRAGRMNRQGLDSPYKYHGRWEWWEGEHFTYGYRKKTFNARKRKNAKSIKPKQKKYYRKARSKRVFPVTYLSPKLEFEKERLMLYNHYLLESGGFHYATCKGCGYPGSPKYMDDSDMAICHDCAKGLRHEDLLSQMVRNSIS